MNYEKICAEMCQLAIESGKFIREQKNNISEKNIEVKGQHDFVTYVDKTTEQKLVAGLSVILPEAGFIAEENTASNKGEKYNWIIDPLDGTTNYIHGIPPYAISIALKEDENIVAGVVYEVSNDECFSSFLNGPALLNGKEIRVSEALTLKDSLIATGFPYYDYIRVKPYLETLEYFLLNTHGVRRLGSAATDLCYVACGRFEAFYEYSLHPWDVAAGAFILKQAGGRVSDFRGEDDYLFGGEIIAANPKVYDAFFEIINRAMVTRSK